MGVAKPGLSYLSGIPFPKQEGHYEIKRGPAEFKILIQHLEGKPLSKIRDVDKKKKILKVRILVFASQMKRENSRKRAIL